MHILVATCYTPFTHDRNARLARELTAELTRRGHRADTVLLPYLADDDPAAQRLGVRLLDLSESAGNPVDRLITLGEPATALRHPSKTAWYVDTARPADEPFLGEARRVHYAALTDAKVRYTGRPLYPPLADAAGMEPADPEPVFLWTGTFAPSGRAALALEAMRFVSPELRLTMLGDSAPPEALRDRADNWGLSDRVEFVVGLSPPQRRDRLRRCLGLLALHHDQPAPDDAVIEALHARRPVLTFQDSGAAAGLIEHDVNGVRLEPDPRLLALALNRLGGDPGHARRLGDGAFATLARHGINWAHVAERLLS